MATQGDSGITWCERTWNPVTGCTPISEGCAHCYAKRQALHLQKMGQAKYAAGFTPMFHASALNDITPRQKPALIFVCSMADLFHLDISSYMQDRVFEQICKCKQHRFMVLTKRPTEMLLYFQYREHIANRVSSEFPWSNVALGATCENQARANERLPLLWQCPAAYRYVSIEPMLGPIDLSEALPEYWESNGLDLVICGGESGPGARPMNPAWARSLRDQCAAVGVEFHFKQWDGVNKRAAGRLLDGVTHDGAIEWRTP